MTDLELYVMGEFDGDATALATDPGLADAAKFEALLRDAAAAATFCAACDDLVRGERCDACGAAVHPGGYTIERVLVGNAHGRMYVAHDADGKKVALKELAFVQSPSLDSVAAFEREAKLLRALEHPAIPRFVASFEEGKGVHARYYLAQELVDGTPLDRLDDHWYREDEIVDIARQVLSVLVYLQSLSPMVIHRDIKPANLIKRGDGTIAVVDFGAAHVQGNTAGSTTIGTFGYMPIEQLAGIVDATTDVYALGTSLIHLLTRQEPWKTAHGMPVLNVSAHLRAWLAKAVAADPNQRFASAKDALAALDAKASAKRRPRWPLIVAAAALVGGGGTFATVHELRGHALTWPEIDVPTRPRTEATLPPEARYHNPQLVDLHLFTFDGKAREAVPLADIVHAIGKQCGLNVVLPDSIQANILTDLEHVPCDQAFESVLESQGLWYGYEPDGNIAFVAPRKQLDAEREAALARMSMGLAGDDPLPPGDVVEFDIEAGQGESLPLHDALVLLAAHGKVNVIVPDEIQGMVSIHANKAPWQGVLQAVLRANGLWYRYKPDSRILRIAPRKQLDAEAEADLARRATPAAEPDARFRNDTLIDLHYSRTEPGKLPDVLVAFAQRCDVNLVVPGGINGNVVIDLAHVRCDQGLETLLASNGLWYRYRPATSSLLISSRNEIDANRAAEIARARVRAKLDVDDTLPPTDNIDIDVGVSSIYDTTRTLAKVAGINVIVPEGLDGRVTIRAHRMPAGELLQEVLEANGLWYRYERDGKLMRVASRKDLDAEDAAELARRPSGAKSTSDSTLTPDLVLAKITAAYMADVKRCYKDYLKKDATARGKLALRFGVDAKGRLVNGEASGVADEVSACIGDQMRAWRFPIPKDKDGEPTEASFSITLQLVPD